MAPPFDVDQITAALAGVEDPEIHQPITELGMVGAIEIGPEGRGTNDVVVTILLTVSGCPLRDKIQTDVSAAVATVPGVGRVEVRFDVMGDEQRKALTAKLRGGVAEREVPFAKPGSLTRVYAIASGKGGVGKSSVTTNLAAAMAAQGLRVGVVDADIYGHSIPRMLGVDGRPTQVEQMILPPSAHGVSVISIAMFTQGNTPVVWRGPMLHRALQQFLADVYWGDLDVLLLDLPPGTGDIAISVAQLVPNAELVIVTTPQVAAAEVAERAGAIAMQTHQRSGGGQTVADSLSRTTGTTVPLLGQVPLDVRLREGGDNGRPLVLDDAESPAAVALRAMATKLGGKPRGLAGLSLNISPVRSA